MRRRGEPEPVIAASYREAAPPEAWVLGPQSTLRRLFHGRVALETVVAGAVTVGFGVGLLLRMTGLLGRHPFSLYLAAGAAAWALATLATRVPRPVRLRRLRGATLRVAEGTRHALEVGAGADALATQLDPRGRVRRLTLLDGKRRPVLTVDAPDEETLAAFRRLVGAPSDAVAARGVRARVAGGDEGTQDEAFPSDAALPSDAVSAATGAAVAELS